MATLVELVAAAIERQKVPGIQGWGLTVDERMEALGDMYEVAPAFGCTSETCAHNSHDPAAPVYKWVPKQGKLVELGSEEVESGEYVIYALLIDEEPIFLEAKHPQHYHSYAYIIAESEVPDWALAKLAEPGA